MRKLTTIGIIALLLIGLIPSAMAANPREAMKEKKEMLQEKHQKAVEKYKTVKEERKTTAQLDQIRKEKQQRQETLKTEMQEEKTRAKTSCKDEKSQECKDLRQQAKQTRKERLHNYSDRIANGLETAIEKITQLKIDDEKKKELIQKLTERRQAILGLKDVVGEEQTTEEEKEATELTRKEATEALKEVRRATVISNMKRFNGALEKAENLQKKLENIIEKAQKSGKDVAGLETLKAEFDEKISSAKESHRKAIELAQDMTKENMKEAINLAKEAHKQLKEAHQVLKEIAKTLREQQTNKTQGNQTA